MLGAGVIYTLVGIKSKVLHVFFSVAALGSLGTTVLILYIMTPPIREAIQGAYVAAIVCTGFILGGASIVFKDTTESAACFLGGFCFGMWLLCLRPGGLLPEKGAKVAVITVLAVAVFALYFIRRIRTYVLIGGISFSGATAIVLGVDCFSRAGLKEFWAYIWALNDNLFPIGTKTYPINKGMRVELAVTVVIAVAGVASQLRLWKVIRERREKRDTERTERNRSREDEEEIAGRRIEGENDRERRQWERVYGNGATRDSLRGSADSGVGDMDSEKRLRNIDTAVVATPGTRSPADENLEMAGISPDHSGAPETAIPQSMGDGVITVRPDKEGVDASLSHTVPFQFGVAATGHDVDERSSVATFADEDGDMRSAMGGKRNSMVNRLSAGSAKLLRSLSQRSRGNNSEMGENPGESQEELVMSRHSHHDDNDSLAANRDALSVDDSDVDTVRDGNGGGAERDIEIGKENGTQGSDAASEATGMEVPNTLEVDGVEEPAPESPGASDQVAKTDATATAKGISSTERGSTKGSDEVSRKARSLASRDSASANLSQGNLPGALSRVAMSYRTNEWAKHLSLAETPEPEIFQLNERSEESSPEPMIDDEPAAPLDMEELQKTAENATPPPAAPRSASAMSNYSQAPTLPRSNSQPSLYQAASGLEPYRAVSKAHHRRTSIPYAEPIAEEGDGETDQPAEGNDSSGPSTNPSPIPAGPSASAPNLAIHPPVPGVVSHSSPQTLIGMRDMFLRSKSQPSFYLPSPTPEPAMTPAASRSASYASLNAATADELPLSYRRELMRMPSLATTHYNNNYSNDNSNNSSSSNLVDGGAPAADAVPYNSHQPQRHSSSTPDALRWAQMANFRSSVAADLRGGAPIIGSAGGVRGGAANAKQRDGEVRRSVDAQRSYLLGLRDADARRREARRVERERGERQFEMRMRSGDLVEAHREAMRRLQGEVKD